jgi:hypothetical protein
LNQSNNAFEFLSTYYDQRIGKGLTASISNREITSDISTKELLIRNVVEPISVTFTIQFENAQES